MSKAIVFSLALVFSIFFGQAQPVLPGASNLPQYLPMLKGKQVAVFANQTSTLGQTHLVDTLLSRGIIIKVIFGPEHGFRGTADAGEKVGNYVDEKTGIPVISLYGSKRRPSPQDLEGVDVVLFDIQDVGVRFYTFISSLEELMEGMIAAKKQLIILDRPNPNGHYVDGPVLELAFKSFVGMQPVPIVYGMTMGEYARMLVGEKWISASNQKIYDSLLNKGKNLIKVIACKNYTHQTVYSLPVKPSPNLPTMSSIHCYPSTCFFEGTVLSEGRGTATPFQVFGHPSLSTELYSFTPKAMPGALFPKFADQTCYGWTISGSSDEVKKKIGNRIQLSFLINAYKLFPDKDHFFILPKSGEIKDAFFNKLAGNEELMLQIIAGESEESIRKSWEPLLGEFKAIRRKYLLYK
ncbi:MAG: hypothetical protein CK547_05620 [Chitinophagaceae bacterium]|nr:MAG: hypothetical protein CK547_05620 [Chitinophagaceae bacterium]